MDYIMMMTSLARPLRPVYQCSEAERGHTDGSYDTDRQRDRHNRGTIPQGYKFQCEREGQGT